MKRGSAARLKWAAATLVLAGLVGWPLAGAAAPPEAPSLAQATEQAWSSARGGDVDGALSSLRTLGAGAGAEDALVAALRSSVAALDAQFEAREEMRGKRIVKVSAKIDEQMTGDALTPGQATKALRYAVELHMLSVKNAAQDDKAALLASPRIEKLTRLAGDAARASEVRGDWLMSAELFARLNMLYEDGRFKKDAKRLGDRLSLIRLYAPQRMWELRNARRAADALPPLPAFNVAGEDFNDKLRGISAPMVLEAVRRAAHLHVERTPMRALLLGGLDAIKIMATTPDLEAAFPGVTDAAARARLLAFVDEQEGKLNADEGVVSDYAASALLTALVEVNRASVKIPEVSLLHEFGNGAFSRLDDYSQIVWPDELSRFRRMTQGSFVGVGVQIQMDDERQLIKVVAPLDDTPAQEAGVRAGDLIKKVGAADATGMTLDQAVEQITGTPGTKVTIVMERDGQDITFELVRKRIPLDTVKGWVRTGPKATDWNWFIDPKNKIGYLRLSGFIQSTANSSAREVRAAIQEMQKQGVRGLIFDLRFNPGGLMDQAVKIVNMFVDQGTIVYTETAGGVREQTESAVRGQAIAASLPMVVLINDNSASASEIVAGALKHYADTGRVNVIVLGDQSFGKGSVQNVMPLTNRGDAEMRLTTQYYFLPNGQRVHKRDGSPVWGVMPHVKVEMLPQMVSDSMLLRIEADLPKEASRVKPKKPAAGADDGEEVSTVLDGPIDPARLLTEPLDLQLQTALVLLQAEVTGTAQAQANKGGGPGPG